MMKEITEAKIITNSEIAGGTYRLKLEYRKEAGDFFTGAVPGQFVNLYLNNKSMLLPRPISICHMEEGTITLVYKVVGMGTKELSTYEQGETIRISTPLGNGYDVDAVFQTLGEIHSQPKTIALVAGGLGVPPMVELAKTIRKGEASRLIAFLGFQDEPFLTEELEHFCDEVFVATERGSAGYRGNVLDTMKADGFAADYYLSCGPKPMLKALAGYCSQLSKPLQISMEERMGCGYGACVGCTCKTRESEGDTIKVYLKKVCKDGPVFFGEEVIWNE